MLRVRSAWVSVICVSLFLGLTGCSKNDSATSGSKLGAVTITAWHWMTDREPAFQELAKRYEAKT